MKENTRKIVDPRFLQLNLITPESVSDRQNSSSDIPSSLRDKISSNPDFDFFLQSNEINGSKDFLEDENLILVSNCPESLTQKVIVPHLKR